MPESWPEVRKRLEASNRYWTGSDVAAALTRIDALERALTRERLEEAGFECTINICAACGHEGSEHDVWNRCLMCRCLCFSTMREEDRWANALRCLLEESNG